MPRAPSLVVLLLVVACRPASERPPAEVELAMVAHHLVSGGTRLPAFEAERPPAWWVRPALATAVRASFEPDGGRERPLPTTSVVRERGLLVRISTQATVRGEGTLRLRAGTQTLWRGRVQLLPEPARALGFDDLETAWRDDRARTEARLHALTATSAPWLRFAAYRMWGRMRMRESFAAGGEIYRRGYEDAFLQDELPTGAFALSTAYVYTDMYAGRRDRARRTLAATRAGIEALASPWYAGVHCLHSAELKVWARRHAAALRHLQRCGALARAGGYDSLEGDIALLQSDQLLMLGKYARAEARLRDARDLVTHPLSRLTARVNLAWTRMWGAEAGKLDVSRADSVTEYERTRPEVEATGTPGQRAETAAALAYLALRRDDVPAARRWAARVEATDVSEQGIERWFIRLVRAEVWLQEGALERAERALEDIIEGARRELGADNPYAVVALRLQSDLHAERGDEARATEALERAWQASLDAARRLDLLEAHNHYLATQANLPIELARRRYAAGDGLGAVAVFEATLAERWVQLRAMAAVGASQAGWTSIEGARQAWETKSRAGCAHLAPRQRPQCRREIADAERAAELAQVEFYARLALPARPNVHGHVRDGVRAVQAALADGAGLLASMQTADDRQVYLLTRGEIFSAAGPHALGTLAPQLAALERLDAVGPVDVAGALAPDGQPWGARLSVRRRPAIVLPPKATGPFSGARFGLVDPSSDLPRSRRSALALARSHRIRTETGTVATLAGLRAALAARPSLFLFTGHGKHAPGEPAELRLADGALTLQDVLTDDLTARVVILNGCATGGEPAGFEIGLPDAWLVRGAHAVLATVAPVQDTESSRFVARFLEAGGVEAPTRAYREAVRVSIEAEDPVWRHYRLWAR